MHYESDACSFSSSSTGSIPNTPCSAFSDLCLYVPSDYSIRHGGDCTPERSPPPLICPDAPRKRRRLDERSTQTDLVDCHDRLFIDDDLRGVCPLCLNLFSMTTVHLHFYVLKTETPTGCNGCCKLYGEQLSRRKRTTATDVPLLPYFE